MQAKHEIDINLHTALETTNLLGRRAVVAKLISNRVELNSILLEKALATYDSMIITSIMVRALESGFKPTTECLNIMIEGRSKATEKAVEVMREGAIDPSYRLYALQAQTIKNLIDAGAVVTSDVLQRAVKDECNFGSNRIKTALSDKNIESTLQTIQKAFERQSEIRKNSRVLAQAFRTRTSLFTTIPNELTTRIASLMGNDVNSIEENKSDLEIAVTHFTGPN